MDWKNNCVIQLFSHFTGTHHLCHHLFLVELGRGKATGSAVKNIAHWRRSGITLNLNVLCLFVFSNTIQNRFRNKESFVHIFCMGHIMVKCSHTNQSRILLIKL